MNTCKHIKDDGTQCRSHSVRVSGFCYFHDPEIPDEVRRENARRGGRVKKYSGLVPRDFTENLVTDTKEILIETLNQLREGVIPPSVAHAITHTCGVLHRICETRELEQRLREIEKIMQIKEV